MNFEPTINNSLDENNYGDYDDRPIRPMDQDALNEALARLPILVDENESDSNTKVRRPPNLAYSTRRKDLSGISINQSLLNTSSTPSTNKRKLAVSTPINKFIKQLDSRQDLIQLKEENKDLEDTKVNLQLEIVLLKKSHEHEIETLKQQHQEEINLLVQQHNFQIEQLSSSLTEKEQTLVQTNIEIDNLRNDQTMLILEKETLDKIVEEYQLIKIELNEKLHENEITIKNLREEIDNLTKPKQQQKLETSKTNNRVPSRQISTDRSNKTNTKAPITRVVPAGTSSNKLTSSLAPKVKPKVNPLVDDKKKTTSTNVKSKVVATK